MNDIIYSTWRIFATYAIQNEQTDRNLSTVAMDCHAISF